MNKVILLKNLVLESRSSLNFGKVLYRLFVDNEPVQLFLEKEFIGEVYAESNEVGITKLVIRYNGGFDVDFKKILEEQIEEVFSKHKTLLTKEEQFELFIKLYSSEFKEATKHIHDYIVFGPSTDTKRIDEIKIDKENQYYYGVRKHVLDNLMNYEFYGPNFLHDENSGWIKLEVYDEPITFNIAIIYKDTFMNTFIGQNGFKFSDISFTETQITLEDGKFKSLFYLFEDYDVKDVKFILDINSISFTGKPKNPVLFKTLKNELL